MTSRATAGRSAPAGSTASTAACSACGQTASTVAEIADLATVWLVPDASRTTVVRRFCRGCAPCGPVEEVVCARCGDGPLLAGALTAMDLEVSAMVDVWLVEAGWRLAGPVCPGCVAEAAG